MSRFTFIFGFPVWLIWEPTEWARLPCIVHSKRLLGNADSPKISGSSWLLGDKAEAISSLCWPGIVCLPLLASGWQAQADTVLAKWLASWGKELRVPKLVSNLWGQLQRDENSRENSVYPESGGPSIPQTKKHKEIPKSNTPHPHQKTQTN